MKCCGEVDLEVEYQLHNVCYVCLVTCRECFKDTAVKVMFNNEMTYAQHREVGRLTLEDRAKNGLNGTLYVTFPYISDLD